MAIRVHAINFSKYFSVGLAVSLLNVLLSFIFIDIVGMRALYSSIIVGIIIFLIKYETYVRIHLIKRKFIIFMLITSLSVLAYIILTTIAVDFLGIHTLIAVPVILAGLFLIRFFAFYLTRIIKNRH